MPICLRSRNETASHFSFADHVPFGLSDCITMATARTKLGTGAFALACALLACVSLSSGAPEFATNYYEFCDQQHLRKDYCRCMP